MVIVNHPLEWYVDKLQNNEHFSLGCYCDGEWIGLFHERIGRSNAEGTVYTKELCDALEQSLYYKDDSFYFSSAEVLKNRAWTTIGEDRVDQYLADRELQIEWHEKDMWDARMKECTMQPFIRQLRSMNVCIISNRNLMRLHFLNYDYFVEIDYPNCYDQIDRVVDQCLRYGKSGVYLICAGLPAALIAQRLHKQIPDSWFIDSGSIFDAFVGIGAQRGWRQALYSDQEKYNNWLIKSLTGI